MILRMPPPLEPGARVALVAPARFASPALIESTSELLASWGYEAAVLEETRSRDRQFGGTDAERAAAFNAALRDPEVGAVWALRGGYGCTRILPLLDGDSLQAQPTWITGFSDITALHGWASGLGVASLHAPVASTVPATEAQDVAALREVWPAEICAQKPFKKGAVLVHYTVCFSRGPYSLPVHPSELTSVCRNGTVCQYGLHKN